jgi:uncharacterized protein YbaR (Trm112 family)
MKLARDIGIALVCPHCRAEVIGLENAYLCRAADCRRSYPIVDGIPKFLIDDATILSLDQWRTIVPQNGNASSNNGS